MVAALIACGSVQQPLEDGHHLDRCHSKVHVHGVVVATDGGTPRPHAGATIAFIPDGSSVAAAVSYSDSGGRFSGCIAPGNYAVTATSPDRAAFYGPSLSYSSIESPADVRAELAAGGVEVVGQIRHEGPLGPNTYVRLIRISNHVGDVFYTPVRADGRFAVRVPAGFQYVVAVVGASISLPTNIQVDADAKVTLAAFPASRVTSGAEPAVIQWLRRAAVPVPTAVPHRQTDEWSAFEKIVSDARVVGLGENGHGVGDFAELRNRFFEAAVSHLGFNVFAIEANFTEALALNDYVLTGRGNPAQLLAGLHFWTSDTEQTSELIEWMRGYNAQPEHRRKVKFYGVDMQFSDLAYREVVRYVRMVDPPAEEDAKRRLSPLADEGAGLRRLAAEQRRTACDAAMSQLRLLDDKRATYVAAGGEQSWTMARQNMVVLSQFCASYLDSTNGSTFRDRAMADNVRWILDTEGPDARVLLWAHNSHVSRASDGWFVPLGTHLRAELGRRYVPIGQFFGHGSFRAWNMQEKDQDRRSVVPIRIGPAADGYIESIFAKVKHSPWALDLRRAPRHGAVREWLSTPHRFRDLATTYLDEQDSESLIILADHFDAVLFFDEVTATRANPTGLRGPESQ